MRTTEETELVKENATGEKSTVNLERWRKRREDTAGQKT